MKKLIKNYSVIIVIAFSSIAFLPATSASAAPPVGLGTASSFAVLSGAGITNSGATTIYGDVGTYPTPAMTGWGSVTQTGVNHADDSVTQGAKDDLQTAYNTAASAGPPTAVATELGGTTLTPGVYNNGTLGITGTLTLDTLGDPDAVFIFQATSTLITAAGSNVVFLNGVTSCNVYWQIASSTTLGSGSHIEGSILTQQTTTLDTGATVHGRVLSLFGEVTLLNNTITINGCGTPSTPVTSTTTTTTTPATAATESDSSQTVTTSYKSKKTTGSAQGRTGRTTYLAGTGTNSTLSIWSLIIIMTGSTLFYISKRKIKI